MAMTIDELITHLQWVKGQIGYNAEVVIKESSGLYNQKINVGWDGDHIIDGDGEGVKVATITSYIRMGPS